MNSENKINNRKDVIDYLIDVKKHLKKEIGSSLSGVYLHGSLINDDGRGFSLEFSDIDLLVTTTLTNPHERTEFSIKLKRLIDEIEEDLKTHLKHREFFPIISVCITTQFELEDGIHKNRNASNAFVIETFHPLNSHDSVLTIIGGRLKTDLVGIHFPAWAILTEAQEIRSNFVSPKSTTEEKKKEETGFNHPFLPLPKELLRNAYLFDCFKRVEDIEMIVEDDIANGINVIKTMLKTEADTDNYAKDLSKLIETNRPGGRNPGTSISSEQILYLWELLSAETQKVLEEHRRGSDMKTLELAADVVIWELTRLKRTSLEAVDTAISLYQSKDLLQNGMLPVEIMDYKELALYEFTKFNKDRLTSIIKEWPEDIRDYLINQLDEKECDNCQCKVGFAGISYSHVGMDLQTGINRKAKLLVRPLNYWILQQFNLEMAAKPGNPELRHFREKYGSKLFKQIEDFQCKCPSGLYVEVAVVTKEGYVTKIPKLAKHSPQGQGRGSAVFTCGFEHGFSWHAHIKRTGNNALLNVSQGLRDGLEKEFLVKPTEIERWDISTLAVHHAHLNAALLGVVHLKLSKGELLDRFPHDDKKHFDNERLSYISRDNAKLAVQVDKGKGIWHQTALMRLNFL